MNNIETAIALMEMGYCVIPSGGKSDGKHKRPLVSWKDYQTNIPDSAKLKDWDLQYKPTLWGIVTGEISHLVVIDADDKSIIDLFQNAGLKPHVKTRRGEHYYFNWPGHQIKTTAGIIMPHLDVRADGGFVNCLGNNQDADYIITIWPERKTLYNFTDLPLEVKNAWINLSKKETAVKPGKIMGNINNGSRDSTLTSLAGSLRSRGLPLEVIEISLLDANKQLCKPPLPEQIVLKIARSISRYQPNNIKPIFKGGVEGL